MWKYPSLIVFLKDEKNYSGANIFAQSGFSRGVEDPHFYMEPFLMVYWDTIDINYRLKKCVLTYVETTIKYDNIAYHLQSYLIHPYGILSSSLAHLHDQWFILSIN